jgi:hypothetical protein
VRDGIKLARRGLPAVTLVTDDFLEQGNFVARSVGMPAIPRIRLPHPVAGTGRDAMANIARGVRPEIVAAFKSAT